MEIADSICALFDMVLGYQIPMIDNDLGDVCGLIHVGDATIGTRYDTNTMRYDMTRARFGTEKWRATQLAIQNPSYTIAVTILGPSILSITMDIYIISEPWNVSFIDSSFISVVLSWTIT